MDEQLKRWRKASRSGPDNQCVELAHTLDIVRDSKSPDGAALTVELSAFLAAVQSGRLDLGRHGGR